MHIFWCNIYMCTWSEKLWGFQATCNPRDNYVHVTGYPVLHGVFLHFLWGKHLQCMLILRQNFSSFVPPVTRGFPTLFMGKTFAVQARLWACGRGDVSTPSFGNHPNPISTMGGRLWPPYTGVHTKFWKPQARLNWQSCNSCFLKYTVLQKYTHFCLFVM